MDMFKKKKIMFYQFFVRGDWKGIETRSRKSQQAFALGYLVYKYLSEIRSKKPTP